MTENNMINEEWIKEIAEEMQNQYNKEHGLICEMARVGYFFRDQYEVYVNTNDPGNEPHFHIRDTSTQGDEFHTCIKIKEAMYFHHDGKEDNLNTHQRKSLHEFLQSKPSKQYKRISFPTNWDKVIYEWNENNSGMIVDEDQAIPDYTNIVDNQ